MPVRFDELAAVLSRAADALGMTAPLPLVRELAARCGWGERDVSQPLLPSGIRHGVPWGVSLVVGAGAPELRVLVEAQHDPPSARAYWEAGARVSAWIAAQPGADVSRLDAIADRFVPTERSRFRVWHAVAFRPDAPPRFRVYLCAGNDEPRLRAALAALGLPRAIDAIPRAPDDELTILSLDLHAGGRVKVYLATSEAPPDDARLLLGDARRIVWLRCFAFAGETMSTTLHLSLERHVGDPTARLRALFAALSLDGSAWERCLPLRHHFVSLARLDGRPRVTVYFLPEVRR
jgi:hypothetical protein